MRKEEFLDYLRTHKIKVFDLNDASKIMKKSLKYTSLRLSRMNEVTRIERGKYYVSDASIYEIATGVTIPSYVSLLSAYSFHRLTTQIPIEIQVVCSLQHARINVEGYSIRYIKLSRERIFGFSRLDGGMIADPEKAIVDSLYLNSFIEETKAVLQENKESLDENRLISHAIRMESRATFNKLGFLMEKYGYSIESLTPLKLGRYVILGNKGNQRDKKWRIIFAD
ncbi:MAG: type IV toxin-antitoxin system AbiEi family antitoxin domain-containing protein [Thermoplasmataceae archaeon]